MLERVAQRDQNAIGVERLLENVVGAELRRLDRGLDGRVAADHHDDRARDRCSRMRLSASSPSMPRHLHVHEDEIRVPLLVLGDRVDRVRDRAHLVAVVLEQLAERGANPLLVVDDEDLRAHRDDLVQRDLPVLDAHVADVRPA